MESTMLKGIIIMLLLSVAIAAEQETRQQPPYRPLSPSYRFQPKFCSDTYSGRQLYVGEMYTRPGQCVRVQCLGTLQLWEDSCKSPAGLKGNCIVLPQMESNLEYPKCCPFYECKTYESNSQGEVETTNTYEHTGYLRRSYVTELIRINKEPGEIITAPARKYQL
ncbi:uncharacterized protein LOC117576188 [Drosophila albomicans]|uniref:Uncharacterized protein LOC117576188 n=1 Tax=Drosophila albomicans TaxID=7291 RepID=A0A6P8XTJ5_DROAB|nr:uncharacterized protein LOC117576188 [Drosophila albomicans]